MKRFKNILVAFDGSSDSVQALKAAETLAKDQQAQLTIAYVDDNPDRQETVYLAYDSAASEDLNLSQSQPVIPGPMPVVPPHIEERRIQTDGDDTEPDVIIAGAKNRISEVAEVTYEILTGKAAETLTNYANDHDIDLIVAGNRGISGMKKLFMGSVSQKITNEASCAVLVVK
ncbi:universal stress protein [Lentibacillus sp. N15]|uniref:universal stress protein n=1 Tax=Lentibacillus songyuanensis TaxID=3136161 RepID=UPI0031BB1F4C